METIHPNNIPDLDINTISLITLKNGNMIMIDDTVAEKPRTKKVQGDSEFPKKENKFQSLTVSESSTCSFEGIEHSSNKSDDKTIKIVKNDFNLVSRISKNTNFSYYGIPNLIFNKNEKHMNKCEENIKTNNIQFSKLLNNFSPIFTSKTSDKTPLNSNILLNENKLKSIQLEENNYLSNDNFDNFVIEEENKEEDINSRINRKSKNCIERIGKMVEDRNKHTVKAVISLNIPCDNPAVLSATEKQFNLLVAQLRGKQSKYNRRNKDMNYQKYYQLYKDNNDKPYNGLLEANINRIKYYQEAEVKDLENDIHINKFKSSNETLLRTSINTNSIALNKSTNNNNIFGDSKNKNMSINNSINFNAKNNLNDFNMSRTSYSFNPNKSRASSDNKKLASSLIGNSFGYNQALVYPCNNFVKKYDYKLI
jgi:hypothetical protein